MNEHVAQLEALSSAPIPSNGNECPWRLSETLDEIECIIQRYMMMPANGLAMLIAVWIANTYTFDRFQYCGYLALRSATPQCGKSRLLGLIASLCKGAPPRTAIPTAAILFRSPRKVLILDEVDQLRNKDKDTYGAVLAVLNSGFERGVKIERLDTSKKGFPVQTFDVYGPKALAGLEALADTLTDRCFQIQMQRTPQHMPRLNERRFEVIAAQIRRRLDQWATAHGSAVEEAYAALPDAVPTLTSFDDRFQNIAEPLVVLASLADAERPEGPAVLPRLMSGLQAAAGKREVSNRERALVAFLEVVKERMTGLTEMFIPTADLVATCQEREELSWLEDGKRLAGFLRNFELYPKSTGKTRGYLVREVWVTEWEARYAKKPEEAT